MPTLMFQQSQLKLNKSDQFPHQFSLLSSILLEAVLSLLSMLRAALISPTLIGQATDVLVESVTRWKLEQANV